MPMSEAATVAWMATDRERSNTTQRDKMGTIDEADKEVGRRVISSTNAL